VWDIKTATWFEDIGFGGFQRLKAAQAEGLKTALVFPVILGDEVLAIFELYSIDRRRPDRIVLGSLDQLGRILGDIWVRKRSEAALRASEERWRSVFETSTLGIMLSDHDMKFVASNRALQAMLGYTADELRQLSPTDLMVEDDRDDARRRWSDLREGRRSNYEAVTRYRRKDGATIWVNTFVSTIPGNEASPPIYFATAIDITDRHRAESELRRSAAYLANTPQPFSISGRAVIGVSLQTLESFRVKSTIYFRSTTAAAVAGCVPRHHKTR
jgi:PAS domain S-box-containing protein